MPEIAESPAVQDGVDLLDSDRPIRRFGYGVVVLLLGLGGALAGFAPIESAALASGVVQVEGKRKTIQHLEGGIVSEILVANGEKVDLGESLILLDAVKDRAELDILQGRSYNTRALVDRLIAERDDGTAVTFSKWLEGAASSDERARNAIASEQALFQARLTDRNGEAEVLQQRIAQYQQQINGLRSVLESKNRVSVSLQEEIADLSELLEEGYVDKQRLRELERGLAQNLGEISDLTAKIAAAEVAIGETRLQILQLGKRFKTEVVNDLTEAQEQFYDLQQQLATTSDRVERATVRAPVGGIILNLLVNTEGAVIRPGDVLLEIVPRTEDLVIDAQISPMDIDRVKLGQEAEIRFAVFKDAYTVTGELVKLSPDSLIDEETGAPYYSAEVKLLQEDLHLLEGLTLVPGMPAEVLVKTGHRTLLSYLTSPLNRMFSRSLIEE